MASPGDTIKERSIVEKIVRELNDTIGTKQDFTMKLLRWENNTFPDFGLDAQDVINKKIGDEYDIFIGIMWKRFGTPTSRAESGTKEEFERAYKKHKKGDDINIMFYFNKAPLPQNSDMEQFKKVKEFKSQISELGGLYWEYDGLIDFEESLRKHLSRCILEKHENIKLFQTTIKTDIIETKSKDGEPTKSNSTKSTSKHKFSITLKTLIILFSGVCFSLLCWNFFKPKQVNVALAINSHDNNFFHWLLDTFQTSSNCQLIYDRELDLIDGRSSKGRVKKFVDTTAYDIIFGGSIGIHVNPKISKKYVRMDDDIIKFAQQNDIRHDNKNKKWIGLYKKYQGIAWLKKENEDWNPKTLDDVKFGIDSMGRKLTIPNADKNGSSCHNFMLNLSQESDDVKYEIGYESYVNLLKNKNVYYNLDSLKINGFDCMFKQTKVDVAFVRMHDAIKLIKEKNISNEIGLSIHKESNPTLSCITLLQKGATNKCAEKFIKFVLSKEVQRKFYKETYKIPINKNSSINIETFVNANDEVSSYKPLNTNIIVDDNDKNEEVNKILDDINQDIRNRKIEIKNKLHIDKQVRECIN